MMQRVSVLPILEPLQTLDYKKQPRWWYVGVSAVALVLLPIGLAQLWV